jgi:hypothetical protein
MTAVSFGTASTGAAISGMSGAAATNTALALLGGRDTCSRRRRSCRRDSKLAGIVLALGGLVWMVKRNRKQQQELNEKLNQAERRDCCNPERL